MNCEENNMNLNYEIPEIGEIRFEELAVMNSGGKFKITIISNRTLNICEYGMMIKGEKYIGAKTKSIIKKIGEDLIKWTNKQLKE